MNIIYSYLLPQINFFLKEFLQNSEQISDFELGSTGSSTDKTLLGILDAFVYFFLNMLELKHLSFSASKLNESFCKGFPFSIDSLNVGHFKVTSNITSNVEKVFLFLDNIVGMIVIWGFLLS